MARRLVEESVAVPGERVDALPGMARANAVTLVTGARQREVPAATVFPAL